MNSYLEDLLLHRDEDSAEKFLERAAADTSWNLVSLIDELVPGLVFESNLTYGSFHQVKMALFLRRLSRQGYLSRITEQEALKLLLEEALSRNWLNVRAGNFVRRDRVAEPLDKMQLELSQGNIHNAMYYALQAYESEPEKLSETLLGLGSLHITDTLGHSLSCFQPVMKEIINSRSPAAETALLSYLSYLGRYDLPERLEPGKYQAEIEAAEELKKAASGEGIINLHHMITLYILRDWEEADFHQGDFPVPYGILQDWLAGKDVDEARLSRCQNWQAPDSVPDNYQEFYRRFSYSDPDNSSRLVISAVERDLPDALDWLFRLYAQDYNQPKWNPHFYTGLYAALMLQEDNLIDDSVGLKMALEQAIRYYIAGMQ